MALRLLLVAGFRDVEAAHAGFLVPVRFFVLHSTVEGFGVLGFRRALLRHFELHDFGRRHQAHRDIPQASGVVPEVDAEGPVSVIHDLPCDQEVQLHRLDVGVKISPAEHFFELSRLHDGSALSPALHLANSCLVR